MNKYNIRFSKDAKRDLVEIYSYIKYNLKEPNIAKKLINKIKEEIYKLKEFTELYPIIDDNLIRKLQIRKIIVDNYIIFYMVQEKERIIQIVRIMYGKRNWKNILRRENRG